MGWSRPCESGKLTGGQFAHQSPQNCWSRRKSFVVFCAVRPSLGTMTSATEYLRSLKSYPKPAKRHLLQDFAWDSAWCDVSSLCFYFPMSLFPGKYAGSTPRNKSCCATTLKAVEAPGLTYSCLRKWLKHLRFAWCTCSRGGTNQPPHARQA